MAVAPGKGSEPIDKPEFSESSYSEQQHPKLSPSVQNALKRLPKNKPVPARALVEQILRLHPEYGGGLAKQALERLVPTATGTVALGEQWIEFVIRMVVTEELHGRVVVAALALSDSELYSVLYRDGFLSTLQSELTPPYSSLLTQAGLARDREMFATLSSRQSFAADSVPVHDDTPTSRDQLQRRVFARVMARLLEDVQKSSKPLGAFLVHLNGPWGSGKTTLLKLLKEELESDRTESAWVVVEFNAWQHQRLRPAWWPLIDSIFRQASSLLWNSKKFRNRITALVLWMSEIWWRFTTGRLWILFTACFSYLILAYALRTVFPDWLNQYTIAGVGAQAKALSEILAALGVIWSGAATFARSLLPGSAANARSFVESQRDPLRRVARHFSAQVRRARSPIVVFIDDLDRCDTAYVVELLEGIQTLMKDVSISYVVAGDRRWLCSCF